MEASSNQLFDLQAVDSRLPKALQVYELLRNAITSLRMLPGESLGERDLCAQLGVSRTPLREALILLETQKLVEIRSSTGTFVTDISFRDVLEGQLVRDTLELSAVRLAARFCTPALASEFDICLYRTEKAAEQGAVDELYLLDESFHKLICTCSRFPDFWNVLSGAKGQLDRVRRLARKELDLGGHSYEVVREHRDLADAIVAHDEELAVKLMAHHLDGGFETLRHMAEHRPDLFVDGVPDDLSAYRTPLSA